MLTFEGIEIAQGDFRLTADFSIDSGALVAVVGPSGAGKSTLLNVIAGFFSPVSGRILWNGDDIGARTPGDRPLSMLFQDNNLFPHLTAFQNVALGLRPDLRLSATDKTRIGQALARVGLGGLENRKPGALSGGQQSRVSLARMLVRGRPLILLDEPFAALGPALRTEMLDLVAELARAEAATLLMVTHDPADALRITGSTVLVAEGLASPPQPTHWFFQNPPPALARYLGPT